MSERKPSNVEQGSSEALEQILADRGRKQRLAEVLPKGDESELRVTNEETRSIEGGVDDEERGDAEMGTEELVAQVQDLVQELDHKRHQMGRRSLPKALQEDVDRARNILTGEIDEEAREELKVLARTLPSAVDHIDLMLEASETPGDTDVENDPLEQHESTHAGSLALALEADTKPERERKRKEMEEMLLEYRAAAMAELKQTGIQAVSSDARWKRFLRKQQRINQLLGKLREIDAVRNPNIQDRKEQRLAISNQIENHLVELDEIRNTFIDRETPSEEGERLKVPIEVHEGEDGGPSQEAGLAAREETEAQDAGETGDPVGDLKVVEKYDIDLEKIREERAPIEALKAEVREKEKIYNDLVRKREDARSALPLLKWINGERHLEKQMEQAHKEFIDAYQRRAIAARERTKKLYVENDPEKEEKIMGRLRASFAVFSRRRYERTEDIRDEAALAAGEKTALRRLKKRYASLTPQQRIVAQSLIGGAIGFGTVAAGITGAGALGLLGYSGYRALRSGIGAVGTMGTVTAVGAGWQWAGFTERAKRKSQEVVDTATNNFDIDNLAAFDAELARAKFILTKDKKWLARAQMASAMAVGGATAWWSLEPRFGQPSVVPGEGLTKKIGATVEGFSESLKDTAEALDERLESWSEEARQYAMGIDVSDAGHGEADHAPIESTQEAPATDATDGDAYRMSQEMAGNEYDLQVHAEIDEMQRNIDAGYPGEFAAMQELQEMIEAPDPIEIEVHKGDTLTEIVEDQIERTYGDLSTAQKTFLTDQIIEYAKQLEKMGQLEDLTGIEHPDRIYAGEKIDIGPLMDENALKPAVQEARGMPLEDQAAYMSARGLDLDGNKLEVALIDPAPEKPPVYADGYMAGDVEVEELAPPAGTETSQVYIDPEKTTPYVVRDPQGRTAYVVAGGNAHDKLVMATELAKKAKMGVIVPAESILGSDQIVTPEGKRLVVSSTAAPGESLSRNVISKDQVPSFDDVKPYIIGKAKM